MHLDFAGLVDKFGPLDLAALITFWTAWLVMTVWIEREGNTRPSVHILMMRHRYSWMQEMAARDVRIFDSAILNGIQQSTAFFGSTTLLAIGGIFAIIGKPELILSAGGGILPDNTVQAIQIEMLMVLGITSFTFLKFAWSNRLFSYCAIVMAAVPNDGKTDEGRRIATRAARLNCYAARSFNRGLRGIYYSLTAMAWVIGPEALIVATIMTTTTLARREFFSRSRQALLDD